MRKKFLMLMIIPVLCSLLLYGCTPKVATTTESIMVFYGDANNEKMVSEQREISFSEGDDKYKIALDELLKGPSDTNLQTNIPAGTTVYGTIVQNTDIIVDLNNAFTNFPGSVAEIIAVGSIINTLTQFEEIQRVKILVEGEELIGPSGEPRGFMEQFPLDPTEALSQNVTLYFAKQDATAVKGEIRVIPTTANLSQEDYLKKVVEALIAGPTDANLSRTIPSETKVLSVSINDKIAHIDFSEEMHTKHWHGAAGESMTINSLVNTLTEFEYVEKVLLTVEGEPLAIEHMYLDEPVERNEEMIER